ncbi:sialidase-1 [Catalinimonas alkaloidigena]|uniref:Sialidase-1 n=1 Tax=Catalinimonas alkaloidigena TaxID=1075417 RepID=A0A1G8XFR8_9BACT|nr:SGNH/GDSL hydrolase family protein [Catalinimonas alkaloidigena]SDJ89154.1 sialidase-1 [Catalinimonas alkaloidigena]
MKPRFGPGVALRGRLLAGLRYAFAVLVCLGLWRCTGVAAQAPTGLSSEAYIRRYSNLENTHYRLATGQAVFVTFLGGSITHMDGWRTHVEEYLKATYPETTFHFRNAGVPSLGSLPHAFRLEQEVLQAGRTDLLLIEAAVNDQVNGTPAVVQQRALEGIIRRVLTQHPSTDLVLMAFADEAKLADYRHGNVPVEVQVHQQLAQHYRLPFVNLAQEVADRIAAGEFSWEHDFKDLHPSPFGQELYFRTLRQLLTGAFHQPLLSQLRAAALPPQVDPYAYTEATYGAVTQATQLRDFRLQESWVPHDSLPTRPGFVSVPMLVATQPDASLVLPFTGRALGIAVVSGPDAGRLQYSIDGKPYPPVELHTRWSDALHVPWFLLLADELSPGPHRLMLKTLPASPTTSAGSACRIVHFLINR